ncbi:hypothetical protein M0R45_000098 [Rubus argutus]|uniref:CCHC-type domain-containing protein n=1 Tax=Rubus argutus TaxID=59490 RepID=A0AAW1VQ87_RUBAR
MIGQTLSSAATSCAVGSKTAFDLWRNLRNKFASSNRQNILRLKSNLQGLKKGGDTIEVYLDKVKVARDALETVGVFLDDEDVVVTVLLGLPFEYNAIKGVIRAQVVPASINDLRTLLKATEIDLESESQSSPQFSSPSSQKSSHVSVVSQPNYVPIPVMPYGFGSFPAFGSSFGMTGFYAGQQSNTLGGGNSYVRDGSGNGGGNGYDRFGGHNGGNALTCQLCGKVGHGAKTCVTLSNFQKNSSSSSNSIECQYCGRPYHTADKCFDLIGFPNQQSQQNHGSQGSVLQNYGGTAMMASTSVTPQFWLADSGVTNHMTSEQLLQYNWLAKRQYDQLHDRFLNLTSEKNAIQLVNQELNNKVLELQKIEESVMVQLSAECRIARERIQKLEFEAKALVSKKIETENLVSKLELQIDSLSKSSRSSENKMQDLLLKIVALETENKDNAEKLQAELQKKMKQIDGSLTEGETDEQYVDLMDKQVNHPHISLEEKEQLILQYKEREKNQTMLTRIEECAGSAFSLHSLTRIVFGEENGDLPLCSQPGAHKSVSAALNCASIRPTLQISDATICHLVDGLTHVVNHLMLTRNTSALKIPAWKQNMQPYNALLSLHCLRTVASLYLLMVLLIFWKLAHACIQTLCRHQVEAEYRSMADTMSELQWLMFLLSELHIDLATVPVLQCDNISILVLVTNPVYKLKHLEVDVRYTRAQVKAGTIKVPFVRSKDQLADPFTNVLCSPQHTYFCASLMLGPLHQAEGGC